VKVRPLDACRSNRSNSFTQDSDKAGDFMLRCCWTSPSGRSTAVPCGSCQNAKFSMGYVGNVGVLGFTALRDCTRCNDCLVGVLGSDIQRQSERRRTTRPIQTGRQQEQPDIGNGWSRFWRIALIVTRPNLHQNRVGSHLFEYNNRGGLKTRGCSRYMGQKICHGFFLTVSDRRLLSEKSGSVVSKCWKYSFFH
jgi:hypothetical protein